MAIAEYEFEGSTFQIEEDEIHDGKHPFLPEGAKRVGDLPASEVPEPVEETVQDEPETPVETPSDADPAPVEESHTKRGRRVSNKQADAPADK